MKPPGDRAADVIKVTTRFPRRHRGQCPRPPRGPCAARPSNFTHTLSRGSAFSAGLGTGTSLLIDGRNVGDGAGGHPTLRWEDRARLTAPPRPPDLLKEGWFCTGRRASSLSYLFSPAVHRTD